MRNNNESITINKTIDFEETVFLEYGNAILKYHDDMQQLGIEMLGSIWRTKCLFGPSKPYDLKVEKRFPNRFYHSQIRCLAHKDGHPLAKQEDYDKNTISFFPLIFPLVSVWKPLFQGKIKEILYYEKPLKHFDRDMSSLLDRIKIHLSIHGGYE